MEKVIKIQITNNKSKEKAKGLRTRKVIRKQKERKDLRKSKRIKMEMI